MSLLDFFNFQNNKFIYLENERQNYKIEKNMFLFSLPASLSGRDYFESFLLLYLLVVTSIIISKIFIILLLDQLNSNSIYLLSIMKNEMLTDSLFAILHLTVFNDSITTYHFLNIYINLWSVPNSTSFFHFFSPQLYWGKIDKYK